jgi:glycosyltransferase involved in cell wall biosynthesis
MNGSDWGGSEELWSTMAVEARARGDDVLASVSRWSRKPPAVERLERAGVAVVPRSAFRRRALHRAPMALPTSLRRLRRYRPDVVCVSQGATWDVAHDPGLFAGLARWLQAGGIPYVALSQYDTGWESLSEAARRAGRQWFGTAATVAFVAESNKRAAERLLGSALPHAVVVQNPVLVAPEALPWPAGDQVELASVARLEAGAKGQDLLLEALAGERWRSRPWRLTLYGSGPHRDWLEALVRHYGLDGRVALAGHVDDVRAVWRRSHLLVLPSRAEGTPLSLLEAMALGRPAVVTDVGGSAEWVVPDETGFVAPAASAVCLGAALEAAWAARERWPAMGAAATRRLIERADPAPGRTLLGLLDAAVRGGAACSRPGAGGSPPSRRGPAQNEGAC